MEGRDRSRRQEDIRRSRGRLKKAKSGTETKIRSMTKQKLCKSWTTENAGSVRSREISKIDIL